MDSVTTLHGNIKATPLVELKHVSEAVSEICGVRVSILGKCEHLHPGGSVKDRAATSLIVSCERSGELRPGGTVLQGTGGNTGVSMAMICASKGYKCHLTIPENISKDKISLFKLFGAEVTICPCVPFSDERHYMKVAERLNREIPGSVLPDQFENTLNYLAHYQTTGPEIWTQTDGKLNGFVCSAGTGGTIAGVSKFLKEKCESIATYLIDPTGSGLKCFVEEGKFESSGGCFIDGIGISRETANFKNAKVDGAFRGYDSEAIEMAYYLLRNEGLFVGPSAALNVTGAVKLAHKLAVEAVNKDEPLNIVTILCDSGERYKQTTFNPIWLKEKKLEPKSTGTDLSFVTVENIK